MTFKLFLQRYLSFTIVKVGLVIGRWLILMLALGWLAPPEFALMAGAFSIVEILRAFGDIGAENVIYARLAGSERPLPLIVKKLISWRLLTSSALGLLGALVFGILVGHGAWLIFGLVFILAFQNTSIAFLQKNRNQNKIIFLAFVAIIGAIFSVLVAVLYRPNGLMLSLLLILPETFAAVAGIYLTKNYWLLLVFSVPQNLHLGLNRLLPFIAPSVAVSILVMCYTRLDILLVLPLMGLIAQANYSAGFRLVEPIFLLLSLASVSLLAELGSYYTRDLRLFTERVTAFLDFRTLVIFLILGCILGFVSEIIGVKFFKLSAEAAKIAGLLALAIPVKILNGFLTSLLQRGGNYNQVLYAAIWNTVTTWIIALILGTLIGVTGIAIGALIGDIINFLFQYRAVKNRLLKNDFRYAKFKL